VNADGFPWTTEGFVVLVTYRIHPTAWNRYSAHFAYVFVNSWWLKRRLRAEHDYPLWSFFSTCCGVG
jgi:hypothetical protein